MNIYDNYNIDTIRNVHNHISAILIGIFYLLVLAAVVASIAPADLLLQLVATTIHPRQPMHGRRRRRYHQMLMPDM